MKNIFCLITSIGLLSSAQFAQAADTGFGVSIFGGHSINHDLTTSKDLTIDLEDNSHFGISVDRLVNRTRYGMYYSFNETEFADNAIAKVDMEYLLFQSAIELPINDSLSSYVGAQIGVNRITPNFAEADEFFASGLFTGIDYHIGAGFHAFTELRWMATIVKNTSQAVCDDDPNTQDNCIWHFDGDVLSQFQFSAGLNYRF
ncbi:outer membrane beta-barrel protein [Pseudoalteromonas sp. Of7M-16]|uniref:outer membrane beta-barrel protein n=1 Tax=Pseudoalteromonas sp. Of7M-16 TaxID=2917756 RepID=UPI001EF44795|nr:outer membrane beta-barrel protein [Pseudoalteromonas sp. Of7M-16]MCG7550231.1 outer membrane beta-barrel protein [Pseudoalteromonas sp. Of7M-16]